MSQNQLLTSLYSLFSVVLTLLLVVLLSSEDASAQTKEPNPQYAKHSVYLELGGTPDCTR